MDESKNHLAGLFILSLFILGGFYLILSKQDNSPSGGQAITLTEKPEVKLITVGGVGRTSIAPDLAVISFAVETKDPAVPVSQQKNADLISGLRKAIISQGVDGEQIQTTQYDIHSVNRCEMVCPVTNPNCPNWEKLCNSIFEGYLTTHTVTVESYDVTNVGKLLDAISLSGASRINSVTLALKPETKKGLEKQLLSQAGQNAKEKAETLASSTGSELSNLYSMTESVSFPTIDYYRMVSVSGTGVSSASFTQTEVSTGELGVTATVTASFEVK